VIDAAPEHDKAALDDIAQEWEVAVRQAINLARRQGEGKLPGFLEEVITDLNAPKVDWREIMRDWIDPSSTKDYTWAKPNRRMLPFDVIAPGTTSDGVNHVGIVIDDSLSISSKMLAQFAGEAQAALDDGKIDKMTVIFCDTRVTRAAEYVMGDLIDFTATGRGGTAFAPAFKWFMENEPDISGLIYLTDLCCLDYGPEPPFKTLWAGYEEPSQIKQLRDRMDNVPFGECIELN
jgi:predicted metal-dependent peptidase